MSLSQLVAKVALEGGTHRFKDKEKTLNVLITQVTQVVMMASSTRVTALW